MRSLIDTCEPGVRQQHHRGSEESKHKNTQKAPTGPCTSNENIFKGQGQSSRIKATNTTSWTNTKQDHVSTTGTGRQIGRKTNLNKKSSKQANHSSKRLFGRARHSHTNRGEMQPHPLDTTQPVLAHPSFTSPLRNLTGGGWQLPKLDTNFSEKPSTLTLCDDTLMDSPLYEHGTKTTARSHTQDL